MSDKQDTKDAADTPVFSALPEAATGRVSPSSSFFCQPGRQGLLTPSMTTGAQNMEIHDEIQQPVLEEEAQDGKEFAEDLSVSSTLLIVSIYETDASSTMTIYPSMDQSLESIAPNSLDSIGSTTLPETIASAAVVTTEQEEPPTLEKQPSKTHAPKRKLSVDSQPEVQAPIQADPKKHKPDSKKETKVDEVRLKQSSSVLKESSKVEKKKSANESSSKSSQKVLPRRSCRKESTPPVKKTSSSREAVKAPSKSSSSYKSLSKNVRKPLPRK